MLIDDEPEFLEASRRTLEAHDYRVQTASSTEQARELLMRLRPDLIVLGTLAPAGQAFILHQWLRRHPRHRDVPLVVVDAASDQRQAKGWRKLEGLQLEADEYLTKPMEPAALVPCIQALLTQVEKTIRVLVADDHAIVRDGIAAVVRLQKGMEVVGEAVDGHDAVEKALDLLPTVILMDIVMPGMNGLEATRRIVEAFPQARILILTQYDEEENMLVARQAGASGFIPKRAASSELVNGIRSVSGGEYFPAAFAAVSSS
jgi:DNA-binding NarL/FixJ family response regulator